MATMASTSHRLTSWTNTCVKAPINPKTKLSAMVHDRNEISLAFENSTNEIENLKSRNTIDVDGSGDKVNVAATGDRRIRGNNIISKDEEFYIKLQQLKEENEKTLEAYKKIYEEKVLTENIHNSQVFNFQPDKSGQDRNVQNSLIINATGIIGHKTGLRKPPTGKPKDLSSSNPVASKTLPQQSVATLRKRPNSAPHERHSLSLDNNDWQSFFSRPDGKRYDEDFVIMTEKHQALQKVKQRWEDFEISESMQRRHSFSTPNKKENMNVNKTKEWRHRVTIPEPFTMTLRESLKEKKKTKAQMELEQRRLEKQKQEEAECEKKFKAQPVPSHVYLPKYEEILEKNESRRQYVKQYCKELLESQVKPFHFEIREKAKKMQRSQSAPIKKTQEIKCSFKAKAVPKHIFNSDIDEKFMEDEELRKIRIKMRAKELLHEASLPPSMAEREKLKEVERQEKAKHERTAKKKMRKFAHSVPDYDALYEEFQKELSKRKNMVEGTVVEPFNLETERIHSHKEKIRKDIEEDEKKLKENRWPFQNSRTTPRSSLKYLGALSNSFDCIPALSTKAADLRKIRTKKEQERLNHRLSEQEEAEKRRKAREAKLRHYLQEKTNAFDVPSPRESIAERLKKKKQEDKLRQETYQKEIEEMKQKIEQSPLLVEKYMEERAKKEAENKFRKTLKNAGLDEKELTRLKGMSSADHEFDSSIGSNSGFINQSDTTYTKFAKDEE